MALCLVQDQLASKQRGGWGVTSLVLLALTLASAVSALGTDLLEVLLQGSQVLTGLAELTLLHTLTDVPVQQERSVV